MDLLKENTSKALISMSLPISIGMLSTFLFQVIDTYFVGQIGADALAALSFSSGVYFLLVGAFIGLSVGVSIIVGRATGAGENKTVKQTTVVSLLLCVILSCLFSFGGIVFLEPIFKGLGADKVILALIRQYMVPLLSGIPLLTTGIMAGSILRANGNITRPEIIMAVAGIINLLLDYLLIFGKAGFPEMGIRGAAFATVASWLFVIIGMLILLFKDKLLVTSLSGIFENTISILRNICKLGLPTVVTQIMGPLTLVFITYLLAKQSSTAVAAFGVAARIETLLMIGILGVSTAMTPFIAQNLGAHKRDRIDEAIAFGGRASTYLGLLVCLLMILFIRPVAALFSENTEVVGYTSLYFYIVSFSYIFYGLFVITSSIFNGLQLPVNSLKIMLVKSFLFTIPLTLLGSFWGIEGIFLALSASNIAGGIYASLEMRKEFRLSGSPLAEVNVLREYKKDILRLFGLMRDK